MDERAPLHIIIIVQTGLLTPPWNILVKYGPELDVVQLATGIRDNALHKFNEQIIMLLHAW